MNGFDLEAAIAQWKRSLAAQQGLEPGFIEELEGNLRDRVWGMNIIADNETVDLSNILGNRWLRY